MPVSRCLVAVFAAALGAATLTACGAGAGSATSAQPTVVATTTQLGDMARAVAGGRAHVEQILKANSDPHEYEPRPSDVRALAGAEVVLRSGGDVDDWLDDVLANAGGNARTVTLLDAVKTRSGEQGPDPHWWQDPRNGLIAVRRIRAALIAADPGGRAGYSARADAYSKRLRSLDRAIASCVERIPRAQRKLVTDHDALGYYADRYAIRVIGTVIPALSTQAQPSAAAVAGLVRTIRKEGVRTLFSAGSVNHKLAEAIARESGAKIGSDLYADTLGPEGAAGATYVGSLRSNTRALVAGLGEGEQRCAL